MSKVLKISDLLEQLNTMNKLGYEYLSLTELDEDVDDDYIGGVALSAVESSICEVDFEGVDFIELPKDYISKAERYI